MISKKIAFVHDWLTGMRGGEKVLEAACELFPNAEIYTLIHRPDQISGLINSKVVRASWLNAVPGVHRYYRYLLPLMPLAIRSFDLSGYDLVLSFSHCVAKGARMTPASDGAGRPLHICYCFTPMRYVHDQFDDYFTDSRRSLLKLFAGWMRPHLLSWDRKTSRDVAHFIADSENVRKRIKKAYARESHVVYPPVDTDFFTPADHGAGASPAAPYYLAAGALVPYKRVDLAIAACRKLNVPLKIIGVGTEEARLKRMAQGAPVEFLGWQDGESLRDLYRNCEALLFPQNEDFGITPVEAMACGRPVIAYGKGGALETVRDGVTGTFFQTQNSAALAEAMRRASQMRFDPQVLRAHALQFSRDIFKKRLSEFVSSALSEEKASGTPASGRRKVKVFEVLECGSPHGVGHQVATLSRHIDHSRFEPWVIYSVRPGFTSEEFERMTSSAYRHVYIPEMVRHISPVKDLVAFWKLYRLMRREKPDVVHAASSKAGVLARAAAWLARVPKIYYSPHGYSFLQTDAGSLSRRFYWSIEKSLSWIGNIIACSDGEEALARGLSWGKKVYQVRNLFVMEPPPPYSRTQDGLVVVGAVGRLTPARNPEAFIRLAERVIRDQPQARFVWIGGGELEDEVRHEVARRGLREKFELTGHLPRERLLQRFADLDIFVHYSRWEGGAPIALHEAMALGLPVVASNIAGNVDLVVPESTGLLADREDDLFAHVRRLVASPDLRAEFGRNGKRHLAQVASLEKSVQAIERLYAA